MYMHCNNIAHTMRYNCDCPSRLRGPICDLRGRRHLGGSKSGEDARLCVSTCVSAHVLCISAARSSAHSAGGDKCERERRGSTVRRKEGSLTHLPEEAGGPPAAPATDPETPVCPAGESASKPRSSAHLLLFFYSCYHRDTQSFRQILPHPGVFHRRGPTFSGGHRIILSPSTSATPLRCDEDTFH